MNDEKLIEAVRKYEFIYNLKHPKYMDSVKKELAWNQIGEEVKQSAATCKQKWQSLRDAYRRALNKRKGKSGQAAKYFKPWKYEDEMGFLAPFFIERITQDSVEVENDEELSDKNDENDTVESTASEQVNTDVDIDYNPANLSDAHESQEHKCTRNPKAVKRRAARSQQSVTRDKQTKLKPFREHDEIDRFFLVISETVKKFSPYAQAVAKNKIFSLVSEMELRHLAPSSSASYSGLSPGTAPMSTSTITPMSTSPYNWNKTTSPKTSTDSVWKDEPEDH